MELLAKLWEMSWGHITSHVSYFSGISMLLPVLSGALEYGLPPWKSYPTIFFVAIGLMIVGAVVLFWLEKSIGKIFRVIGWMMLIPGMVALLFAVVSSDFFFQMARNAFTGFTIVEPTLHWLVEHNVPKSVNVGAGYVFIGIILIGVGNKIKHLGHYL